MVEGKENLKISSTDFEAAMRNHMRGVAAGEEGKKPFEEYVSQRRVPFAERLIEKVRGILGRGNS